MSVGINDFNNQQRLTFIQQPFSNSIDLNSNIMLFFV